MAQKTTEKIKIGSYQGPVFDNDIAKNVANIKKVSDKVRHEQLDFLCFPETYLSGYSELSIKESALAIDDPVILDLLKWSIEFDTVFLIGFCEKRAKGIFNSQLVFYKGELLGVATKTMLTRGYDDKYFVTDLEMPVFQAKGIKFGVAICHTTSFVEPALYLRLKGVRLLFTPHFNNMHPQVKLPNGDEVSFTSHRNMVLANQAALATSLKIVVIRSNIVVVDSSGLGSGDSNMWDMDGQLVAYGAPFTECVVMHEFDKNIFLNEHSMIDRREVPLELYGMIYDAGELHRH